MKETIRDVALLDAAGLCHRGGKAANGRGNAACAWMAYPAADIPNSERMEIKQKSPYGTAIPWGQKQPMVTVGHPQYTMLPTKNQAVKRPHTSLVM